MTRGQLVIITKDRRVITSTEFNGDMYPEGYGKEVMKLLSYVETIKDFESAVQKFNDNNFNYEEQLIFPTTEPLIKMMDMTTDYFKKWSSDYLYVKNLSDSSVDWVDDLNNERHLLSEEVIAIHFGGYTGITDSNIESYLKLREEYSGLSEDDLLTIVDEDKADKICGIYEDTYDVGKEYAIEVFGISDWLDNDRYINFEAIGEDEVENTDAWLELPSGKYAHLS